MQILSVGTLFSLLACGAAAAAAEGVDTSPEPPSPEKSRFVTQVTPDFDAVRAVQDIVSPNEHIQFHAPTEWRLFVHPSFQASVKSGTAVDNRVEIDAGLVIYYHPARDVLCGVSVHMLRPQAAPISGFGSKGGIRLSPAETYLGMVRHMQYTVELDFREFGVFTWFKPPRTSPLMGPNYRQFEWQYVSDHDQSLTEGFGDSDLIKSTITLTVCNGPKGAARNDEEAAILSELRQSYTFIPPQSPQH